MFERTGVGRRLIKKITVWKASYQKGKGMLAYANKVSPSSTM